MTNNERPIVTYVRNELRKNWNLPEGMETLYVNIKGKGKGFVAMNNQQESDDLLALAELGLLYFDLDPPKYIRDESTGEIVPIFHNLKAM